MSDNEEIEQLRQDLLELNKDVEELVGHMEELIEWVQILSDGLDATARLSGIAVKGNDEQIRFSSN